MGLFVYLITNMDHNYYGFKHKQYISIHLFIITKNLFFTFWMMPWEPIHYFENWLKKKNQALFHSLSGNSQRYSLFPRACKQINYHSIIILMILIVFHSWTQLFFLQQNSKSGWEGGYLIKLKNIISKTKEANNKSESTCKCDSFIFPLKY